MLNLQPTIFSTSKETGTLCPHRTNIYLTIKLMISARELQQDDSLFVSTFGAS